MKFKDYDETNYESLKTSENMLAYVAGFLEGLDASDVGYAKGYAEITHKVIYRLIKVRNELVECGDD